MFLRHVHIYSIILFLHRRAHFPVFLQQLVTLKKMVSLENYNLRQYIVSYHDNDLNPAHN